MFALRLPPEIEDGLEALARRVGRSKDDHARGAILDRLDNLENLAAVEQRLAAVQSGDSDPHSREGPAVTLRRGGLRSRVPRNANSPGSTKRRPGASWGFLRDRVSPLDDPRAIGEALKGSRAGNFRKIRIGDFLVIADNALRILVIRIVHRRDVYP